MIVGSASSIGVAIYVLVAVILSPMTQSGMRSKTRQVISSAKRIDVSVLDSRLPSKSFGQWFRGVVGAEAKIKWEVNDCGEQTGTSVDRLRDLPSCAEAEAELADARKIVIRISVGTLKKGVRGQPRVYDMFVEEKGHLLTVKTLYDLLELLRSKR
jgi:hypothetical protein